MMEVFFIVVAGLYFVSNTDFNRMKTFLLDRISMPTTYMYIYFNEFTLLTKSINGLSSLFPFYFLLLFMFFTSTCNRMVIPLQPRRIFKQYIGLRVALPKKYS